MSGVGLTEPSGSEVPALPVPERGMSGVGLTEPWGARCRLCRCRSGA